jgi:hypothetical protein
LKRLHALVIGNSNYQHSQTLKNPVNDAEDIARVLESGGFKVTKIVDSDCAGMDRALKVFAREAKDGDVALFFFAGHGVQIDGANYLIATDTPSDDESDAKYKSINLDHVIQKLEKTNVSTKLLILDACRENPWAQPGRGGSRGLAPVYAPRGTLIAYSTSPGQVADDGTGRNGAYTSALLQHIETPDVPIEIMFKNVRNTLSAATKQRQTSWEHTSLAGEFYFNLSAASRIDEYSATAIKDKTFVLDMAKKSHQVIKALRSGNWHVQNPAIAELTVDHMKRMGPNNLFVVGRNILQAADGSSNSAQAFLTNFTHYTAGLPSDKVKNLLDGILFEIYFDSDGELRDRLKDRCFDDVFEYENYPAYKLSFDFIAACLTPYAHKFFTLPGKGHTVSPSVRLDQDNKVESILVGGREILGHEDEFDELLDVETYRERDVDRFEAKLARDMRVPVSRLNISYTPARKGLDKVKVPGSMKILLPA